MSFNANHQDWDPVVLRKKNTGKDKGGTGEVIKKPSGQTISTKTLNDFDPENITKPVTSNVEVGKAIEKGRMAQKIMKNGEEKTMTQSDLDKLCNLPTNT